mmetsp:Transcript_119235/g.380076  ORF Transcript_119235/g.380076 Transcript_119235/m.380076 type:complete len:239 (+) Transcript_119235:137-853(+)
MLIVVIFFVVVAWLGAAEVRAVDPNVGRRVAGLRVRPETQQVSHQLLLRVTPVVQGLPQLELQLLCRGLGSEAVEPPAGQPLSQGNLQGQAGFLAPAASEAHHHRGADKRPSLDGLAGSGHKAALDRGPQPDVLEPLKADGLRLAACAVLLEEGGLHPPSQLGAADLLKADQGLASHLSTSFQERLHRRRVPRSHGEHEGPLGIASAIWVRPETDDTCDGRAHCLRVGMSVQRQQIQN